MNRDEVTMTSFYTWCLGLVLCLASLRHPAAAAAVSCHASYHPPQHSHHHAPVPLQGHGHGHDSLTLTSSWHQRPSGQGHGLMTPATSWLPRPLGQDHGLVTLTSMHQHPSYKCLGKDGSGSGINNYDSDLESDIITWVSDSMDSDHTTHYDLYNRPESNSSSTQDNLDYTEFSERPDNTNYSRITHRETVPIYEDVTGISLDIHLGFDTFIEFHEAEGRNSHPSNGLVIELEDTFTRGDKSVPLRYVSNYTVTSLGTHLAHVVLSLEHKSDENHSHTHSSFNEITKIITETVTVTTRVICLGAAILVTLVISLDVVNVLAAAVVPGLRNQHPHHRSSDKKFKDGQGEITREESFASRVSFTWIYIKRLVGILHRFLELLTSSHQQEKEITGSYIISTQTTPSGHRIQHTGQLDSLNTSPLIGFDSQETVLSSPLQGHTTCYKTVASTSSVQSTQVTITESDGQIRPSIPDDVTREQKPLAGTHVTSRSPLIGQDSPRLVGMVSISEAREEEEHGGHPRDLQMTSFTSSCIDGHNAQAHHSSLRMSRSHLRMFAFLAFGTMLAVTMAMGMSRLRTKPTVHVVFPASTSIRKVRMFTDYPDLAQLSRKHSSLSLVSRLQLLDAKQCADDPKNCKVSVVCDSATDQSVNCRCRTGYYFKEWKCEACSTQCPAGHFLQSSCTDHNDVVCKPCTVCGLTQYSAAVCNTHRDTICIDVSFPVGVLPFNRSDLPDDGIEISISHTPNVFLERLIDMQRLDTPMYVTNNQQILDFVWERPSGMDISVSVTGVYLIPTYHDLDAVDDTTLFHRLVGPSKTAKDYYNYVQNKFCRHPVPDYYSLQLEIIADRAAAAQIVRCDSQDTSSPSCPSNLKDGDRYLKWDINKPCVQYSPDKLTPLTDGYNSVVCNEETDILRDIFQQIRPTTNEWMFPSQECETHRQKCQECVRQSDCPKANKTSYLGDDSQCCGIQCFSTNPCQKAYSSTCPPPKVECAQGEVNIFSLFPKFNSMEKEFSCHLKYSPPRHLYNITYSIQIPSIDYNSTERHFYVEAKSKKQHQRKSTKFDFITVHHDTRIPIEEEIMLVGDHLELSPYLHSLMKPFTIRQLKTASQLAEHTQFQPDSSGHITYVQFEKPFLYSSMSWFKDGCMKNISQIYPNQTIYGNNFIPVEAKQGLQSSVFRTDLTNHPGYTYQLYRRKTQPLIKFVTKQGTSVLRHLQGRDVKGNLVPNSLYGRVTWHYETETWKLVFSGTQDKCPTVISLKIFTQLMTGCAGHFDLLINCPNDFTVTFNFSTSMSDLPDVFVLQINDSLTSHHMVLSSMYAPIHMDGKVSKNKAMTERQLSFDDDNRKNYDALWQPIFAILGISFMVFVAIIIAYHYVNTKARITHTSSSTAAEDAINSEPELVALNNHGEKQNQHTITTSSSSSSTPKTTISIYIFAGLYLVYSLVFTFSLTFLIVYMAHSSFWGSQSQSQSPASELQKNVNRSIQEIQEHERSERSRLFSTFRDRQEACVHHLKAENKKLLYDYQKTTRKQMDAIFMENGTLHVLSEKIQKQNVSTYINQIAGFVSDCNKTIYSIVQRFEANYFDFLKKTVSNEWLRVPQQIFLVQGGLDPGRKFLSSNQIKQFASWLEVDKVEELLVVKENVAHRLSQVPVPTITAVEVSFPSLIPHMASSEFPDFGAIPQQFTLSVIKPESPLHNSTSISGPDRSGNERRYRRNADESEFEFGFSGFLNRNIDHVMPDDVLARERREEISYFNTDSDDSETNDKGDKKDDNDNKKYDNNNTKNDYDEKINDNNNNTRNGNQSEKEEKEKEEEEEERKKSEERMIYDSTYRHTSENAKTAKNSDSIISSSDVEHKDFDVFLADDPSLHSTHSSDSPPSALRQTSSSSSSSSSSENTNETDNNKYFYILIGVFILLDLALFMYRFSWLCSQLYAAKHGYADRIPTDEACKQVLEIQTAYHLPAYDNSLDNSVGYYVDGKDQLYVTEPERERDMTFLQSFPKTKDDILQKIWNERQNNAEERRLRSMRRCFLWRWCAHLKVLVQRLFLSQLVWQTTVTILAIIFICISIYCIEFWLTTENFRTLVGGQSATSDVQWQLDTSGRYLQSLAYQLTTELGRMRVLCEMEVNTLTDAFFSTLNMQTTAFTSSLQRLCIEAEEKNCEKYLSFKPAGGRIVGCNFLPLQAHTFQDLNLASIENLVSGEVMPFLNVSRRVMALSSVVIIFMLCLRLVCQAGATTVRHYFLLSGRLPRVKVYQAEEQTHTLKHGGGPHSTATMQRSQSWVDSCESGVYVGEGEDATANKEEMSKRL